MITLKELLGKYDFKSLPADHQANMMNLLQAISKVREAYGKPMNVSSCYRSEADHLRIYEDKAKKAGVAFDKSKIPMRSKHLSGLAVDISGPDVKGLQKWCKENEEKLREMGIWMERFEDTPTWAHFQIKPYGSYSIGKSIFFAA